MIRKALIADLPAITEIYNQAIRSRVCTGDTMCFSAEARLPWFLAHNDNPRTPVYVFESGQGVTGYAYISAYRPGRQALESVGEISYYVDFNHHRKGIGGRLLQHLLKEAEQIGYAHLIAVLLECNPGSMTLLEKYGFEKWGTLPKIARIDNNYYSHLYYGITLMR